jgi:predicted phosphodiesterase
MTELHDADTLLSGADKRVGQKQIKKMAEELIRRGVDPEELGRLSRMKMYQAVTKDEEGEAHIHDLWGFHLDPSWDTGPKWPVVQPAPAIKLNKRTTEPAVTDGWSRCVVVPDIQIGFLRSGDGTFEPTHDTLAIDMTVDLIKRVKPSTVVLLGDNLDLPEFGKYRQHPSFQLTTQMTIDAASEICARFRDAAGDKCEIVWLAGNHEERMPNYIIDNAKAAFGIKRAGASNEWPVLSVPFLLRLDDYEIFYLAGYPSNHFWLTPHLRFIHGHSVKSKGSTAHLYLNDEKVSVIYGHIHRNELAYQTRIDYDGTATIMAASPGCLARVDGHVPSMKQGFDLDGRPVISPENWQQGLAVVDYHEDGRFDYKPIHINTVAYDDITTEKWMRFENKEYRHSGEYTIRMR